MKTTIELPDELAREARELARAQGVTLRALMVEGLRSELERRTADVPKVDFHFPASRAQGWLKGDLTLHEAIIESYGDRA